MTTDGSPVTLYHVGTAQAAAAGKARDDQLQRPSVGLPFQMCSRANTFDLPESFLISGPTRQGLEIENPPKRRHCLAWQLACCALNPDMTHCRWGVFTSEYIDLWLTHQTAASGRLAGHVQIYDLHNVSFWQLGRTEQCNQMCFPSSANWRAKTNLLGDGF